MFELIRSSAVWAWPVAFAAGLFSTVVCPCTLPTGISIVALTQSTEQSDRLFASNRLRLGFFLLGLVLSLTVLGAAMAVVGRALLELGATFAAAAALVILAFAAVLLFAPRLYRTVWVSKNLRSAGPIGAFAYGGMYSVATVSSSGAPMLAVLTASAALANVLYGAALAALFAIGRGAPFLLVGLVGMRGSQLRWFESHQRRVELVSAAALASVAGYYLWLASVL